MSRVWVTEGKITVKVGRKSRGNRFWFELAKVRVIGSRLYFVRARWDINLSVCRCYMDILQSVPVIGQNVDFCRQSNKWIPVVVLILYEGNSPCANMKGTRFLTGRTSWGQTHYGAKPLASQWIIKNTLWLTLASSSTASQQKRKFWLLQPGNHLYTQRLIMYKKRNMTRNISGKGNKLSWNPESWGFYPEFNSRNPECRLILYLEFGIQVPLTRKPEYRASRIIAIASGSTREIARKAREILYRWATQFVCTAGSSYVFDVVYVVFVSVNGFHGWIFAGWMC